jgi:hypothetical protein
MWSWKVAPTCFEGVRPLMDCSELQLSDFLKIVGKIAAFSNLTKISQTQNPRKRASQLTQE